MVHWGGSRGPEATRGCLLGSSPGLMCNALVIKPIPGRPCISAKGPLQHAGKASCPHSCSVHDVVVAGACASKEAKILEEHREHVRACHDSKVFTPPTSRQREYRGTPFLSHMGDGLTSALRVVLVAHHVCPRSRPSHSPSRPVDCRFTALQSYVTREGGLSNPVLSETTRPFKQQHGARRAGTLRQRATQSQPSWTCIPVKYPDNPETRRCSRVGYKTGPISPFLPIYQSHHMHHLYFSTVNPETARPTGASYAHGQANMDQQRSVPWPEIIYVVNSAHKPNR